MFRPNTLFIIGAGASCEFGLPTGDQLKEIVAQKLNIRFPNGFRQETGDLLVTEALRHLVTSPTSNDINPHLQSCRRIRDAMPQALSIDNFLDAHRNDHKIIECGKIAIARTVLEAEQQSVLMPRDTQSLRPDRYATSWLIPFAQKLTEGCQRENISKIFENVGFIVFNYDRCLEHALKQILQNYYFIDSGEAAATVRKAVIYHPYGVVGALPWQAFDVRNQTKSLYRCLISGRTYLRQSWSPRRHR